VIRELRFIAMSRQCGFSLGADRRSIAGLPSQVPDGQPDVARLEERIAELDAEIAQRRALRKHLVSHVAWFGEREPQPASKPGFPRVRARGGDEAGSSGRSRRK
jgi:hypothetical protein